ncbi:MAG: DUF1552 domain-containing protein [Planctomycetaceae bacterium]|nr:DUF1552 domain-containing protein [Planctomycetaceae bacterium]
MIGKSHLSRRTVLKGLGISLGLPLLEAMTPTLGSAAETAAAAAPRRAAFLYVPNGVNVEKWRPTGEESDFQLSPTLTPLEPFRESLCVLEGMTLDGGRAHKDGAGDHARALSSFLTASHPKKTHGADIRAGVSVDQLAARALGEQTRFPSLEVGCEQGSQAGNCDSGYSCAYSANISWRTESSPVAKETNPRLVFERLFLDGAEKGEQERMRRMLTKKSLLDFVLEDANDLQKKLGGTDRRKIDEYLTSVRELEQRIERAQKNNHPIPVPDYPIPDGIPKDYKEHLRLMADMVVLAFQSDVTRVSTFVFANEGSNRSYNEIGVSDGHHSLSHHEKKPEKLEALHKINLFHIEQLAYMLEKMRNIKEGDSTLLDNSMIVYGSGLGDGNRHNHDDLPILLLGGGGGSIKSNRYLKYPAETPMANLYLSMLDRLGIPTEKFADSNGRLDRLS